MVKPNYRRVFLISVLLSLLLTYSLLWLRTLNNPAEYTGSDFMAFYTAGRIAEKFGPGSVYDIELQQAVQQQQVGFELAPGQVLLYNHMPYEIPLLQLAVIDDYVDSFIRWNGLLLSLYAASIFLLVKTLDWEARSAALAFGGGLTFFPIFASLLNGQDTAFLVLGAALFFYLFSHNHDFLGGVGLSLASVRPHLVILFIIPFLFKRRSVLAGFAAGASALALLSIGLLGLTGTGQFTEILLLTMNGEWHGIKEEAMFNLIGLMARSAPYLGSENIRLAGWIAYAGIALVIGAYSVKILSYHPSHFGALIAVSVFFSPHLHYHDLALLIVSLFALMKQPRWAPLPLLISFIMFLGFAPPLRYIVAYLVTGMLAFVLWSPARAQDLWQKLYFRFRRQE